MGQDPVMPAGPPVVVVHPHPVRVRVTGIGLRQLPGAGLNRVGSPHPSHVGDIEPFKAVMHVTPRFDVLPGLVAIDASCPMGTRSRSSRA